MSVSQCPKCGADVQGGEAICQACGAQIHADAETTAGKQVQWSYKKADGKHLSTVHTWTAVVSDGIVRFSKKPTKFRMPHDISLNNIESTQIRMKLSPLYAAFILLIFALTIYALVAVNAVTGVVIALCLAIMIFRFRFNIRHAELTIVERDGTNTKLPAKTVADLQELQRLLGTGNQ